MNNFELITALITPFLSNGLIDYPSLKKIIINQLENDIDTFVLFGTTGEGSTISLQEKVKTIRKLKKDFPLIHLIIGISSTNTLDSGKEAKIFSKLKVDALLVLTPSYLKTNEHGVLKHYEYINNKSIVPIYIYYIPKRTGQVFSASLIELLKKLSNIKGIKEASNSLKYFQQCLEYKELNFQVYSGDDLFLIEALEYSSNGLISVISNAYPKTIKNIINTYFHNQEEAKLLFDKYKTYFELFFIEPNPIPIKYLMAKLGFSTLNYHLPLYYPNDSLMKKINENFIGDDL